MTNKVYLSDNLRILSKLPDESVDLVYIDPPFNTGKTQSRKNEAGEIFAYADTFHDSYLSFLRMRLLQLHRVLKPSGSLYLHLDYREVHYARYLGDQIFGRQNFLNEIIWAYDYGAKPKNRWPAKHDNILLWAKNKGSHIFNVDDIDREPYMAPGMAGPEKVAKGKLPTDCWWHTIVSPTGKEKTGYPTQKPLGVLERIIRASAPAGGLVLDCFAGSGTTGEAALRLGREFILIDENSDAVRVMKKRFAPYRETGHDIRFLRSTQENT